MKTDNQPEKLRRLFYLLAVIGIVSIFYSAASRHFTGSAVPVAQAQADPFLERRITQMESRFYSIESRINRLEQEFRLPAVTPRIETNNDVELRLLSSQTEALRLRIGELECALLKLDERTLSETARRARSQAGQEVSEPCRKGVSSPLKLSARP